MVHFRKFSPKNPPLSTTTPHFSWNPKVFGTSKAPGLDILRVEAIVYAPARGVAETQMALGPWANSWVSTDRDRFPGGFRCFFLGMGDTPSYGYFHLFDHVTLW
jgi:hypothetical protein